MTRPDRDWTTLAERLTPKRVEAFWSYVAISGSDECWLWKGAHRDSGYGQFALFDHGNVPASAHRIAYGLANTGIPKGMHVLHRCDNPPCCNPAHLFAGTQKDNMADKKQKGRDPRTQQTHCKRGHEFTPDNTYAKKNGSGSVGRGCRECLSFHSREYVRDRRTARSRLSLSHRSAA